MKTQEEMEQLGFVVRKHSRGYTILGYVGDDKDIVIPNGVTDIGYGAFAYKQLTSVVFPKSLKFIGESAFTSNKLTKVNLENLRYIGAEAFAYNKLEKFNSYGVKFVGYGVIEGNAPEKKKEKEENGKV